jgi:sigma-B regulation protein RsbU (phosphoserine phosphatase)
MDASDTDRTVATLLESLGGSFRLDARLGERRLGEHLEAVMLDAATAPVEFGTPGDETELRRSSEGVMSFFYRPHLFPGMDPALHLAHLVQYSLLPKELPPRSPVAIAAMLESYCHLSGDLFGWQMADDGVLTLWVLDVSGHGVRAGIAAVIFKLILGDTDPDLPLPSLAREIENRFLEMRSPDDPGCIYATGALLRIGHGGIVDYLSAGHPPLFVRRGNGSVDQVGATSVPLALFPEVEKAAGEFSLAASDTLLVCTDGLLELQNNDQEVFGPEHAAAALQRSDGSPHDALSSLIRAVAGFHDLDRLDDDLSLLVARRIR